MKPNAIKAAVVRAAVNKGIADIRANPDKGIRSLAGMAELLAGSHAQTALIRTLLAQVRDEHSACHRLVERLVCGTEPELLSTFGINLGYNALVHGAGVIRRTQAREGFLVPWCLELEAAPAAQPLLPATAERLIEEGRALGIYSYLVRLEAGYPEPLALLEALGQRVDCAVVLLTGAEPVNPAFRDRLLKARNILPVLELGGLDDGALKAACALLAAGGCLRGGFSRLPQLAPGEVGPGLLAQADALDLPIYLAVRKKAHRPYPADDVYNRFARLREHLSVPVLPIDLYADTAHAGEAIAPGARLATVKSDGALALTAAGAEETVTRFNLHHCSLKRALAKSQPGRMAEAKSASARHGG